MSFLGEILARKRERVNEAQATIPHSTLREQAIETRDTSTPHRLLSALRKDQLNVIAEFKRKSPSKGIIRADCNARSIVQSYEAGGAAAISVLTEQDYFDGSLDDLRNVKSAVGLPVLRKDFLFDEYQMFESAAAGADAILLIVAALDDESLQNLRQVAEDELGMDALVEVHNEAEMKRAVSSGAKLIGVNNRNLHTFDVSLEISLDLATRAPSSATLISESGLRSAKDLGMLRDAGYQGFLIGESLMRADDPEGALRSFLTIE